MPCIVKKTFEEAAAAGALLIAQVKDNQPTLHQRAEQVCQTSIPVDQTTTKDAKRRSRDETRVVEVFDPNAALADTEWADHVGAIIRVSRTTHARQLPPAIGRRPARSRISSASSYCPPPSAPRRSAITGRSRRPRHDDSPGLMSERVCGACRRVRRSRLCHTRAPQARDDWRGSRLTKAHGIWPTRRAVIKGRATITPAGMMFDADAPGRGLISSPFRI